MWKSSRRRDRRGSTGSPREPRPGWGHPPRYEDDWAAQRTRELVQFLALTSNR